MKKLSALSKAALMAVISGAGVPAVAALNHMLRPAGPRALGKPKTGRTPADREAIAKAEAKRARRANRNKEPV